MRASAICEWRMVLEEVMSSGRIVDEFDIDHKIEQWFQNNTFSVTVD